MYVILYSKDMVFSSDSQCMRKLSQWQHGTASLAYENVCIPNISMSIFWSMASDNSSIFKCTNFLGKGGLIYSDNSSLFKCINFFGEGGRNIKYHTFP